MLTMNWDKVDKFYLTLIIVLICMSFLLVVSFRGVFTLFISSYEVDTQKTDTTAYVQKEKLDSAYNWVFADKFVKLDVVN